MLFETIALSVITLLLFCLLLTRKPGKLQLILGVLTAVSAEVSLVLFVLMQHASGNPDAGGGFFQLYLPCCLYGALGLWGAGAAFLSWRKLRRDKAAKESAHRKKDSPDHPQ